MPWIKRDFQNVRTQVDAPTTGLVTGQTLWHVPGTTGAGAIKVWNGTTWDNYLSPVEQVDEEFLDGFQDSVIATQSSVEDAVALRGDLADATEGASLVAHKANATYNPNAIPTTVIAKLRDHVSVTSDYGALGDGSSGDFEKIQSAMEIGITTPRTVEFPPASVGYLLEDPNDIGLKIPSNRTLRFSGKSSQLIFRNLKESHTFLRNADETNGTHNVRIEDLYIDGNWQQGPSDSQRKTAKPWSASTITTTGALWKPSGTEPTNASQRRVYRVTAINTVINPTGSTGTTEPTWPTNLSTPELHAAEYDATYVVNGITYQEFRPASEPFCIYANANDEAVKNRGWVLRNCHVENWWGIAYRMQNVSELMASDIRAIWVTRGGFIVTDAADYVQLSNYRGLELGDDVIAFTSKSTGQDATRFIATNLELSSRADAEYGSNIALRGCADVLINGAQSYNANRADLRILDGEQAASPTVPRRIKVANFRGVNAREMAVEIDSAGAMEHIQLENMELINPAGSGLDCTVQSSLTDFSFDGTITTPGNASHVSAKGIYIHGVGTLDGADIRARVRGAAHHGVYIAPGIVRDFDYDLSVKNSQQRTNADAQVYIKNASDHIGKIRVRHDGSGASRPPKGVEFEDSSDGTARVKSPDSQVSDSISGVVMTNSSSIRINRSQTIRQIVVSPGSGAFTWTNMPSAFPDFLGSTAHYYRVDLNGARQGRMSMPLLVAGASGARLRLQYSTDNGANWNSIAATGTLQLALDGALGFKDTGYVALTSAARTEVLVKLVGVSGDNAADPSFGAITMEFS